MKEGVYHEHESYHEPGGGPDNKRKFVIRCHDPARDSSARDAQAERAGSLPPAMSNGRAITVEFVRERDVEK